MATGHKGDNEFWGATWAMSEITKEVSREIQECEAMNKTLVAYARGKPLEGSLLNNQYHGK